MLTFQKHSAAECEDVYRAFPDAVYYGIWLSIVQHNANHAYFNRDCRQQDEEG